MQFTGVAEQLLIRDEWRLFREWLRGDGDIERYVADLSRPGALTAGLNWYRANVAPHLEVEQRPPVPAVAAPTLGLWSSGDNYLTEDRMIRSGEHAVLGPFGGAGDCALIRDALRAEVPVILTTDLHTFWRHRFWLYDRGIEAWRPSDVRKAYRNYSLMPSSPIYPPMD